MSDPQIHGLCPPRFATLNDAFASFPRSQLAA